PFRTALERLCDVRRRQDVAGGGRRPNRIRSGRLPRPPDCRGADRDRRRSHDHTAQRRRRPHLAEAGRPPRLHGTGFARLPGRAAWLVAGAPPTSDPRTPAPVALWRTTDGGRSWRRLAAAGLPQPGFPGQWVFVDALRGTLMFTSQAGSRFWLATTDGGDSWQVVKGPDGPFPGTSTTSTALLRYAGRLLAWLV